MATLLRLSLDHPSQWFAYSEAMRLSQRLPDNGFAIGRLKDFDVPVFDKVEFGPTTGGGHFGFNVQKHFTRL